jgi:hypothetical protein
LVHDDSASRLTHTCHNGGADSERCHGGHQHTSLHIANYHEREIREMPMEEKLRILEELWEAIAR